MKYEVIKDKQTFEIDDNIFFDAQPKDFRDLFNELKAGDMADFDNCTILVLDNNRVIITEKEVDNG